MLVAPLPDLSICTLTYITLAETSLVVLRILQFILSTILFILVVIRFLQGTFQIYRATRKWELDKYISLLVRDGLLYFLAYVYLLWRYEN